jgi:hypothetical protein
MCCGTVAASEGAGAQCSSVELFGQLGEPVLMLVLDEVPEISMRRGLALAATGIVYGEHAVLIGCTDLVGLDALTEGELKHDPPANRSNAIHCDGARAGSNPRAGKVLFMVRGFRVCGGCRVSRRGHWRWRR